MTVNAIKSEPVFLVVEDTEEISELIGMMIETSGASCDCVADGFSAIKRVRDKNYSGVFIDLDLPEIDGASTARVLKILNQELKLIMMTAGGATAYDLQTRGVEMYDFLAKPFSVADISGIIEKIKTV